MDKQTRGTQCAAGVPSKTGVIDVETAEEWIQRLTGNMAHLPEALASNLVQNKPTLEQREYIMGF